MKPFVSAEALRREKQRVFLAGRGGVSLPVAGTVYWSMLGVAGFFLTDDWWCLVAFFSSGLIFPLGILLSRPLGADLFVKSPLSSLWLPAFVPIGLSFAITIPAFYADTSLVPLALAVGMSLHWPVFGWLYDEPVFLVHAVTRTAAALLIWIFLPDAQFTVLPLSVGAIYLVTVLWLLSRVRAGSTQSEEERF